MICPYCSSNKDKVIDSRSTEGGAVIRRRRECLKCERRYTTYERVEQASRLTVIKKDGTRVPFDRENVLRGVRAACGKRPISEEIKRSVVEEIEDELHSEYEREVSSAIVGERVMFKLRPIDLIAYIRFATEHLQLSTLEEIRAELDTLRERPPDVANQEVLFEGR
jgi:transcriptional repressor NrdR